MNSQVAIFSPWVLIFDNLVIWVRRFHFETLGVRCHTLFFKLRSVILRFLLVCSRIQNLSISPVRQFIIRLFTLPVCAMRTSVCIYELVYASAVHHSLHLEDIFTVINNIENITRVTWGKIQSFVTSWWYNIYAVSGKIGMLGNEKDGDKRMLEESS